MLPITDPVSQSKTQAKKFILQALAEGYQKILILEDDATPVPNMEQHYRNIRVEISALQEDEWDLL